MPEFVLDAHAAQACPVKVQHAFTPQLVEPGAAPLDEGLAELFARGRVLADQVVEQVLAAASSALDARTLADRPWEEQEAACLEAMAAGVDVIVGGVVPRDLKGHRSGRPTWWQRVGRTSDGRPGYAPVKVKNHQVQEKRQPSRTATHELLCSALADPSPDAGCWVSERAFRTGTREKDLIQLSHYWRLLEAAAFAAAGTPWGGVVGTDVGPGGELCVTWVDLSRKQIRTFSRTAPERWKLRAPLERYDHEHQFRVKVAQVAAAQTGSPDDPPLMVHPIVVPECSSCRWWEVCRPQLGDEDISLRIDKSPLDVREIAVLRSLGVATIDQLADVDLDALLPRYLPEVAHRPGAEDRVRLAARRARLMAAGIELERESTGPIVLPQAEVEIDFDIETSGTDRVYLWGFYVRSTERVPVPPVGGTDGVGAVGDGVAGTEGFVPFVEFSDLSAEQEVALAARAMGWLRGLAESGRDVRVYHYSDYELVKLGKLARASQHPDLLWAVDFARDHFVDLFAVVKQHFFGTSGLGLKAVARQGAGFAWRDDDPGGLNSQSWFHEAVHGETAEARQAAARRVLEYNEDDVRATDALRSWLRSLD